MKVGQTAGKSSSSSGVSGNKDVKVSGGSEVPFKNRIESIEYKNYENRIHELVDRIEEQGKKLSEKVDIKELKIYKKLISEFLQTAVNDSFRFSKESFLSKRGRYKVYTMIKKINDEVESLTKDVLSSEGDNIKILKRVEDIRGLILDLMM